MPKSWMGSRYTGYNCTPSRLRKIACAVTGPGVTTCRFVNMSPRLASMTKPVACAVVFHSVSKARVLSIWMVTTPLAILSRVCAQVAGELGIPGAGTCAVTEAGTGVAAAKTRVTDKRNTGKNNAVRDMPILGLECVQCPWSDKIRNQTV